MESLLQDVRYAVRGLLRNPGFTVTAILSLVLGIGASLAIFTVTDNLLLRPLPYRDPGRLTIVWESNRTRKTSAHNVVSPGNYFDWKRQNDVFESMAVFRVGSIRSDRQRPERGAGQAAGERRLLPMLGVQPVRGRLFTAEEDKPGDESALLISYRLWQSWFGGDEKVVGGRCKSTRRRAP